VKAAEGGWKAWNVVVSAVGGTVSIWRQQPRIDGSDAIHGADLLALRMSSVSDCHPAALSRTPPQRPISSAPR